MGRSLPLSVNREWYSLHDIQEVFRISRKIISEILVDANERGIPIRIAVLDFRSHPLMDRERPFVRVERQSLMAYLVSYCGMPESEERNSPWMKWLSPRDVELIYGFSQESLKRMIKDAAWKEMPIRTMRLPSVHSGRVMKSACYQTERQSLDAYLNAHVRSLV